MAKINKLEQLIVQGKVVPPYNEADFPGVPSATGLTMSRPSWDEYFMQVAFVVATRATCPRRSVGAVIVLDKRILATGYNGAPRGLAHCTEVGCHLVAGHCIRALHAEQNAILQAAMNGVSTRGATVYVYLSAVQPLREDDY